MAAATVGGAALVGSVTIGGTAAVGAATAGDAAVVTVVTVVGVAVASAVSAGKAAATVGDASIVATYTVGGIYVLDASSHCRRRCCMGCCHCTGAVIVADVTLIYFRALIMLFTINNNISLFFVGVSHHSGPTPCHCAFRGPNKVYFSHSASIPLSKLYVR